MLGGITNIIMRTKQKEHNSIFKRLKENINFLSVLVANDNPESDLEDYLYSNNKEDAAIARELLNSENNIEKEIENELSIAKKTRTTKNKATSSGTAVNIKPIERSRINRRSISTIDNNLDLDR